MGLKDRLRRLEEAMRRDADVLVLEDGSQVPLAEGDRLECLLKVLDGEDHEALHHLLRPHPDAPDDQLELASLLRALGAEEDATE